MNLRKRKSTKKQVETRKHSADDIENTVPSFLIEEKQGLNTKLGSSKRVKLEEVKSVLNETIKIEDNGDVINGYREDDSDLEEGNKKINVSEKVVFRLGGR